MSLHVIVIANTFFFIIYHNTGLVTPLVLEGLPLLFKLRRVLIMVLLLEHSAKLINL